jgi:hypothetical protein
MGHSGNLFAPPFDHIRSGDIADARRCCRSRARDRNRFEHSDRTRGTLVAGHKIDNHASQGVAAPVR